MEEESDVPYKRLNSAKDNRNTILNDQKRYRRLRSVCHVATLIIAIMAFIVCLAVFLSLCLVTPHCHGQLLPRVTIRTPLGNVSGLVTVLLNSNVHQFLGIPYAEPPLNQLRFRKPVPVQPWANTLDATQFGSSCPQPGWGRGASEDCLYLNVYVRANDSFNARGLKAVMMWIHGGGFVVGSGRDVDGSRMAVLGDVVVVTINYRLGMLGWLSTMDESSPGNYGLWDQKVAIEWVRDNIAAFGGDPNQITIFGESGGGYSVGLQTLSPLNNGLFQRAIMQSGSALNRRTIALDPVGFAQRLGYNLRCLRRTSNGFDTRYLIECARQRSVNDILRATSAAARRSTLAWLLNVAPVIDGELIPTDIRTLLGPQYRRRVPFWTVDVMVGTTNAEGSLVLSPLLPFQRELGFNIVSGIPTRVLCENITTALARDYFQGSSEVSDALCGQYNSSRGDEDQGRQVVNLYGDMMFVSAAVETLQRHANVTEGQRGHYQYQFSHTPISRGVPYPWFRGAGHGAEVSFVFGMFITDRNEDRLSRAMLDGWTNFAKFGTPNDPRNPSAFQWPAYDLTNKAYTNLDLVLTSPRDLYSQRMEFWLQSIPNMGSEVTPLTPNSQVSHADNVTGSEGLEAGFGEEGNFTNGGTSPRDWGVHGHFLHLALKLVFPILLVVPIVL